MLLFVDKENAIRVFRLVEGEEGAKRVRLGAIQKSKMQIDDELRQALEGEEEIAEVEGVIARYVETDSMQTRLDIARFPEIARNVIDYLLSKEVSDIEKRVFTRAVVDAVRKLRSHDEHAATDSAATLPKPDLA